MRSKLGGHIAGTGIASPTAKQFDDFKTHRSIKVHKPGMLPTDFLAAGKDSKEKKKAFEQYCKEQSSNVTTYTIDQLEKREEQ
jgi:hypothetical protein